ncbi:MAG: hypothetical protein RL637_1568 [Pseudomonadota bacterium]|jgi:hypothetical protein
MKRNYQLQEPRQLSQAELNYRLAYHEAGHAVAIHLYNQQQQLPAIFFQITLNDFNQFYRDSLSATIQGGCLIQNLPSSFMSFQQDMTAEEKQAYFVAMEADMINLLSGAIAEAYYVSLKDGELLNSQLFNLDSLDYYGGCSDKIKIQQYLYYLNLIFASQAQCQRLQALIERAFNFITNNKQWQAVIKVAEFILQTEKPLIHCEELFNLIDN